jgi:hypothetical protein
MTNAILLTLTDSIVVNLDTASELKPDPRRPLNHDTRPNPESDPKPDLRPDLRPDPTFYDLKFVFFVNYTSKLSNSSLI